MAGFVPSGVGPWTLRSCRWVCGKTDGVEKCARKQIQTRRRRCAVRMFSEKVEDVPSSSDAGVEQFGPEVYVRFAKNVGLSVAMSIPLLFMEMVLALLVFTIGALYSGAALLHPQFAQSAVDAGRATIRRFSKETVRMLKSRTKQIRRKIIAMLADDEDEVRNGNNSADVVKDMSAKKRE